MRVTDRLNRLSTASVANMANPWGYNFRYDHWGNLLNMTVTQGQNVPGLNVSVNGNNQIVGNTYDAAGNLTNDGAHTYQYDAEGRLIGADNNAYTYNALGERVEESLSGGASYLEIYYDVLGNRLVTYNRTTEEEDFFAPVGGRNYVKYENSRTDYLHVNNLGSTGLITDQAGNLIQDQLYYP